MSKRLFLCYRQDDSAGMTGRLHDRLVAARFSVFMDVRGIPIGENYVRFLSKEVGDCDALLIMMGPNWLDARSVDQARRLENPNDSVRIEITAALERDIPVIPIFLDGAPVPKRDQLPTEIKELSERIGIEVRHSSFDEDCERLIRRLNERAYAGKRIMKRSRAAVPVRGAKEGRKPKKLEQKVEKSKGSPQAKVDVSEWIVRIFVSSAEKEKAEIAFARQLKALLEDRLPGTSPFPITYLFVDDWTSPPDIFIPVLSRFWALSEVCKDDLHRFTRLSSSKSEQAARIARHIFAVYREPIDRKTLPSVLEEVARFNFYPSKSVGSAENDLVEKVSKLGLDIVQYRLPTPWDGAAHY